MKPAARRHTAFLFCLLSFLVLGAVVVPHHHHHDRQICLKDDLRQSSCCRHRLPADECGHCCCNKGCITTHFFQRQSQVPQLPLLHPSLWKAVPCDGTRLPNPSSLPGTFSREREYTYLESLHGTFIARAKGLRAPPLFLPDATMQPGCGKHRVVLRPEKTV